MDYRDDRCQPILAQSRSFGKYSQNHDKEKYLAGVPDVMKIKEKCFQTDKTFIER